jgi:hypothetical protein
MKELSSFSLYAIKYDGIVTHSLIIVDPNEIALYKGKVPKFVTPLFVGNRCLFSKDFFILLKDQVVVYSTPLSSVYPLICRDIVLHAFVNKLTVPLTVDVYKQTHLTRPSQFVCYFPSLELAEECFPFRGQVAMQRGYTIMDRDCVVIGESRDIYYAGYDILSRYLHSEVDAPQPRKTAHRQLSQHSISLSDLSGPVTKDG